MTKPLIEQVAEAERFHRTREAAKTLIGQASIPMPHRHQFNHTIGEPCGRE